MKKKKDKTQDARIVAIGASAGGLEALREFFTAMRTDLNLAWVIVQHLSPDYKSVMDELLRSFTSMPIHQAEAGVKPEPDNIYLIPANNDLTLNDEGQFALRNQERGHYRPNLPINIFFESLAAHQGKDSIGVILSGTGSDGTRGARAIREVGGIVMVQSVESAKFNGMPKSIIENDLADFVGSAAKLPDLISNYLHHPVIVDSKEDKLVPELAESEVYKGIFEVLRNRYRVDFDTYKSATVNRRIERRLSKTESASLQDYLQILSNSSEEAEALFQELLIGVTSFYRDMDVFNTLQMTHLPRFLETTDTDGEFRVWVAGCSTGEEAYTIAIILSELMEERGVVARIKVFATDLNARSITRASQGLFSKSIANDLPAEILAKYFRATKNHYVINRSVREKVVFAKHDVVNDPPFTRIHLVVCRNLLIYLKPATQVKVLSSFSFALQDQGLLLLGESESLGDAQSLYSVIDQPRKLFANIGKARGTAVQMHMSYAKHSSRFTEHTHTGGAVASNSSATSRLREELRLYEAVLDAVPKLGAVSFALLLNDHNEIVRVLGSSKVFLKPLSGSIDISLKRLLRDELQISVNSAITKAATQRKEVQMRGVSLQLDDQDHVVNISVLPISIHKTLVSHFLVSIADNEPVTDSSGTLLIDPEVEVRNRVKELEQQLQITRENLQSTIEELETSNEELQATNEELLSSNEELQSTNEELQSVNEELFTINNEHQERLHEMSSMRAEVQALLATSQIATIILDDRLRVLSFSDEAVRLFNIIDKDLGHPISHITNHLGDYNIDEVALQAQQKGERFSETLDLPKIGKYRVMVGPMDVQEPDLAPGVIIAMQGPIG